MREVGWAATCTIQANEDGTTAVFHPGLPADAPLVLQPGQKVKLRMSAALHAAGFIEGVGWEDEIEGVCGTTTAPGKPSLRRLRALACQKRTAGWASSISERKNRCNIKSK